MKKCLKIALGVICAIVILLAVSIYVFANKGYGLSVGRYLEVKDNNAMLICGNSPISMHNRTNWDVDGDLDIGDKILVIHTGIAESYPAQTGVYAVFKIGNGTRSDIPQNVINQLVELGWFEPEKVQIIETINTTFGTYYKMSDGTWKMNGNSYKYRLEISGRMPNAVLDSTFVYLSNIEEISFQRAYLAAGLSSSTTDYFSPEDAVFVDYFNIE